MTNSILNSVKKHIGIIPEYDAFDDMIATCINTVFLTLNQLGVGPKKPFVIEDEIATWDDFFTGSEDIQAVKTYMDLKVRMMFDPPSNGGLITAITDQIKELEWRLNVQVDPGKETT